MSIRIKVTSNVQRSLKQLRDDQRHVIPRAMVEALNKTALDVRDALGAEMGRAFSQPTRWTLNSLFIDRATTTRMYSSVKLKDFAAKGTPASVYLAPQIFGGNRVHTRFEKALYRAGVLAPGKYAIPARDVPRDGYGNVSGGLYTKILSALQASPDPTQNQTTRTKDASRRKGGYRYFVFQKGGRIAGIARSRGRKKDRSYQVLFFFGRAPRYSKRYRFFPVAHRTALKNIGRQVDKALARELARTGSQ